MKKVTSFLFKVYMLIIYFFAMIGITGVYAAYIVNVELDTFIQIVSTILYIGILGVFFVQFIKLLILITKNPEL